MITFSDVCASYGRAPVLHDISCTLDPGVTALVGRNGAGKSTLLRVILGLLRPDSGEVTIRDAEARGRLGWVPQLVDLPSRTRVGEFVRYCAWLSGIDGDAGPQTERALEQASLLDRAGTRIGKLSGGQQRRVMVAAALVDDPLVLLLDEPTVGLDPEQRAQFHRLVRQASTSRTTVLATHLMEDVLGTADSVVSLVDGRVHRHTTLDAVRAETGDLPAAEQMPAMLRYLLQVEG